MANGYMMQKNEERKGEKKENTKQKLNFTERSTGHEGENVEK